MSKLDKDQVLADFSAAFEKANGKAPSVEQKGSWYTVDGGKSVRLADLASMAAELSGGAAAPKAAAPKAAAKKAPAKKAPAKKAPAKKAATKKAANGGLTPKQAWAAAAAAGSKAPRGL